MTQPDLQERFLTLVDDHRRIVYKICHSYCWNRDDRDDLAQEIIVQLWRSFSTFDDRYRFSTWMYRVGLNVAISFYRRERTRARYVIAGDESLLEVADDSVESSMDEEVRELYRLIDRLDELNKALVLLHLDGHSYREIADVLGISETNVATKLSRLRKSMQQSVRDTAQDSTGSPP
jgi:RNA polymerase sigma factor (sigma-70 family)